MSKKTRQRITQIFAILAILGIVLSSLAGGLMYLI
jgi:hypothetical protein